MCKPQQKRMPEAQAPAQLCFLSTRFLQESDQNDQQSRITCPCNIPNNSPLCGFPLARDNF